MYKYFYYLELVWSESKGGLKPMCVGRAARNSANLFVSHGPPGRDPMRFTADWLIQSCTFEHILNRLQWVWLVLGFYRGCLTCPYMKTIDIRCVKANCSACYFPLPLAMRPRRYGHIHVRGKALNQPAVPHFSRQCYQFGAEMNLEYISSSISV